MSQGRGKRGAAEHSSRNATPSEKVDRPTPESSVPSPKKKVWTPKRAKLMAYINDSPDGFTSIGVDRPQTADRWPYRKDYTFLVIIHLE